jgi:hypothetical protein
MACGIVVRRVVSVCDTLVVTVLDTLACLFLGILTVE